MIIIDTALQKRLSENNPIRVALIGAGYSGRNLAYQIIRSTPAIRLVAIVNRTISEATRAYRDAGISPVAIPQTPQDAENNIAANRFQVTDNAALLCEAEGIDAIIEATGTIEYGASVVVQAIGHGKNIILMNAELDATVGPILKALATEAGVIYTNTDGDEPGVAMNLYRLVESMGLKPVAAGNLKGFYDPHRTPESQAEFAKKNNQKPRMMTSFVDGTKLSMELAVLANATGLKVGKRGMYGPHCAHVNDAIHCFPIQQMLEFGLIDFLCGAAPGTGAFVLAHSDDPIKQQYLKYLKMGDGPIYAFYTPFHLPHLELPNTIARAVLFRDAAVTPKGKPVCDVIAVAKRDLSAGEVLDGLGGFTCYSLLDNYDVCRSENLLPMGISEGCIMQTHVAKDQPISYGDVVLPQGRFIDTLRQKQLTHFK